MRYERCAGGTTCNDLPAAGNLGGALSPQQIQGRALVGVLEAKPPKDFKILQLTLAENTPFTLNYNFVNFVD